MGLGAGGMTSIMCAASHITLSTWMFFFYLMIHWCKKYFRHSVCVPLSSIRTYSTSILSCWKKESFHIQGVYQLSGFLQSSSGSRLTLNDDHINLCQSKCSSRNLGMDLKISAIRPYMEKVGEYWCKNKNKKKDRTNVCCNPMRIYN